MDRLIVIALIFGFAVLGFIVRLIEYKRITKRIETTYDYRNKFVEFLNELMENRKFNDETYIWLTENVNKMQAELGDDGIYAHMHDPFHGVRVRNYQMLINFLPKLRNFVYETAMYSSGIMNEKYAREAGHCDDAFIRHVGTLNSLKESQNANN